MEPHLVCEHGLVKAECDLCTGKTKEWEPLRINTGGLPSWFVDERSSGMSLMFALRAGFSENR